MNGVEKFNDVHISFVSKSDHNKSTRKLNQRFSNTPAVPEILKNYGFLANSKNKILIKRYSDAKSGNLWDVNKQFKCNNI